MNQRRAGMRVENEDLVVRLIFPGQYMILGGLPIRGFKLYFY